MVAMCPGKRVALDKNDELDRIVNEIEYLKPKFRPFCSPVDGGKCLSALINLSNERSIFN